MKLLLCSVAALFATLCASAQEQVYVVLEDGSALSYSVDKVSTISFDASEASTVKGYSDLLKEKDDLKEQCDTLKKYYYLEKGQLVDLGLESGTLWATYNVGANQPEEYGSYFAWGETTPKDTCTIDNSKWYSVPYTTLQQDGIIDSDGNLTAKYDAATVNWGKDWRMPTKGEIKELCNLTSEPKEINGVQGRLFHGKNGSTLFVPFAGDRGRLGLVDAGVCGNCWSASAGNDDANAYTLYVDSDRVVWLGGSRHFGLPVHAVLRYK